MITVEGSKVACGCRSAGECEHNTFVEGRALTALVRAYVEAHGIDDEFAERMRSKLWSKAYRDGYSGWDDPANEPYIRESLARHEAKGDPVDVENLRAFLWNFQQAPAPAPAPAPRPAHRQRRPREE